MKRLLLKFVDSLNLYTLFNRFTKNTATVFMIHSITPGNDHRDGAVSEMTLRRLLGYLNAHRYHVVSLSEYIDALINHKKTYKTIVFTVDDGYRDFYLHAFPIFKEYGYPASIFLTSDFIENRMFFWWDTIEYAIKTTAKKEIDLTFVGLGRIDLVSDSHKNGAISLITNFCKVISNKDKLDLISKIISILNVDVSGQPTGFYEPLKWDEIKEMNSCKIDFYPHTKTHPILSRIDHEQKIIEISEPKEIIECKLGSKTEIFCYPNGLLEDFDEDTISILKSSGHIAAVTGIDGFDSTVDDPDLFRLHRFVMPAEDIVFKQYASGLEAFKRKYLGV